MSDGPTRRPSHGRASVPSGSTTRESSNLSGGTIVASPTTTARTRAIRIQEPTERRPLLSQRAVFPHDLDGDVFSCFSYTAPTTHRNLPVYTNIHRIRRDIISVVEDYLSLEQLRDVRLNVSVIRPLVDKLYEQDDISIVYCLLVNRAYFLSEQSHLSNRQNVNFTRAALCELIATRILRRFNEDNEGPQNLLVLAHILIAGFEPFQNAPDEIRQEVSASTAKNKTLPALEVAILSESRVFLASTSCQKVVDAIYQGRVIYTPSSFMDLIPDRYKQRPISLYNPREAPLLNHYRLVVPRTRHFIEIMQFIILLTLYLAFMTERDPSQFSKLEVCFTVYALGWVLDQFATLLEHGWHVYAQNLWSFLDVIFAAIYSIYLLIRIYGWRIGSVETGLQALDVLATGALVLVPRLAFNLLSDNLLFLSLRSMMSNFALLTALAIWCFVGFLLSLVWLGNGGFSAATISKWMIYIWFGLDGSGIQYSPELHKILGPSLMVIFAFLGNTLFLTILVSMLSTTFSNIVNNASAEIQFRRAVATLEGVKGDAIFAYPVPFNILAFIFLVPLKMCASPRWFHKIHVTSVRLVNLPLLLVIALAERRSIWPLSTLGPPLSPAPSPARPTVGTRRRFWERWRPTSHSDISTVFEVPPPDSVLNEIATDDELTRHLIRRQFAPKGAHNEAATQQQQQLTPDAHHQGQIPPGHRPVSRRDSIAPFPGLRAELQGVLSESDEVSDITSRLETLEESMQRIEGLLKKLVGSSSDTGPVAGEGVETGGRRPTLVELNREAEEE
ncbi:Calcium channel YVC1 [Madurella mycetomatis]|uniref:Calcium channel YVC1 n=1 Tax=Madurella mycetomatis TaxID=100816 RepID=A0A175VRA3_9PEZI|nr:Calcium channel YVC1 [Madurella mycetomatis]